ncbi:MAG: hypothetical protein ACRDWA_02790 [Acidimicrobiia bacterium]
MVKSSGAQRESDGVVVPGMAMRDIAGGKGPGFGQAGDEGKREGMAGIVWSNHPRGRQPAVKVRLQRRLWAAAKQSRGRRFHALYDRVHRGDVLWEGWRRVRANRGAAGVDGVTLAAVEEYGVQRMLDELAADLGAGIYRPVPMRRVEIGKPDGAMRPLGIPTGSASRQPSWCSSRSSRRFPAGQFRVPSETVGHRCLGGDPGGVPSGTSVCL